MKNVVFSAIFGVIPTSCGNSAYMEDAVQGRGHKIGQKLTVGTPKAGKSPQMEAAKGDAQGFRHVATVFPSAPFDGGIILQNDIEGLLQIVSAIARRQKAGPQI